MHSLKYTSTRHFALSGFSSFALYELSDRWIFHGLRPKITYKKKSFPCSPSPRAARTQAFEPQTKLAEMPRCLSHLQCETLLPTNDSYYQPACLCVHKQTPAPMGGSWKAETVKSCVTCSEVSKKKKKSNNTTVIISSLVKNRRPVNDLSILGSPLSSFSSAGICSNQGDPVHLAYADT